MATNLVNHLDGLVPAAVKGDPQAIGRLLTTIRPLVVRYCRARVGRGERGFTSADDIAQEACLAILTALPRYEPQGRPFLAFVYGITAHKVADAHRAAARNREQPVADIPDTPEVEARQWQLDEVEQRRDVIRALELLPMGQRQALAMVVIGGLTPSEVAQALGQSVSSVRASLARARKTLTKRMSRETITGEVTPFTPRSVGAAASPTVNVVDQRGADSWVKSETSQDVAACVEMRFDNGTVRVRDSKNANGPQLAFTSRRWELFLDSVRARELPRAG